MPPQFHTDCNNIILVTQTFIYQLGHAIELSIKLWKYSTGSWNPEFGPKPGEVRKKTCNNALKGAGRGGVETQKCTMFCNKTEFHPVFLSASTAAAYILKRGHRG